MCFKNTDLKNICVSIAFEAKTNEKYEETNLLRFFFFKTQKRTFLGSTNFLKNFFPVLAFKTMQAQMFFYSVFLKTKKKLLLIQYIVIKYMVMAHLRGQKKILKKRANHLFALFALKKQAINTKKQLLNSQPWLYPRHHGVFFFFRCPEAFFIYVCFIPLGVLYPEDLQLAFSTTVCHRCLLLSIYQAVPSLGCKAPNVV